SGPFVLTKAIPGASMAFDRNPNYFKTGLPYLDGIDFVIVGDQATREAAFLTGKQLVISLFAPQYMDQLEGLVAQGKMNLTINRGGCGITGIYFPSPKPPFTDIKVRKAINLALDRKALATIAWGAKEKYYTPTLLFFGRGQDFATPEEQIWNVVPGWGTGAKKQQEIDEAKKLMVDAGFANGIDMGLITNNIPPFGHYAIAIPAQQQLAKIGIRAKIEEVTSPQKAIRMEALDYQLGSATTCVLTRDADEVIGGYWITGAARNVTGTSDPEIDDLYIKMSSELDPVKRKEFFFKMQDKIVLQDVRYAPMTRSDSWVWSWPSFKGYYPGLDGMGQTGKRFDHVWIDK
ncbi:MAG: ABC transporter substrate-binding protein, partial [Dehalococcoidia bacterium]|nr:ABC transporter substrate-binding protein [Dehalococcoidia bacterium]